MFIRIAQEADIDSLITLQSDVHNIHVEIEPLIFREASEKALLQYMMDSLNDEQTAVLVAENDGRLIGYMLLKRRVREQVELLHERRCVFIEQVCIAQADRHKGVFSALLNHAKDLTLSWGFHTLELDVWTKNGSAKQAFRKAGFTTFNEKMKIDLVAS